MYACHGTLGNQSLSSPPSEHHTSLSSLMQITGQPVLIGGTMGTHSYVLTGTTEGMNLTFGSTCHGAVRDVYRRGVCCLKKVGARQRARKKMLYTRKACEMRKVMERGKKKSLSGCIAHALASHINPHTRTHTLYCSRIHSLSLPLIIAGPGMVPRQVSTCARLPRGDSPSPFVSFAVMNYIIFTCLISASFLRCLDLILFYRLPCHTRVCFSYPKGPRQSRCKRHRHSRGESKACDGGGARIVQGCNAGGGNLSHRWY